MPALQDLRSLALFASVTPEELETLASAARGRVYHRGELVLGADWEHEEGLYIIARGSARLFRLSDRGQEITLAYMREGDIFGLVFIEPVSKPLSSVEAAAHDTLMYRVPRHAFRAFMTSHPDVAVQALGSTSKRLAEAYNLIAELALHDSRTRLALTLARLAREAPNRQVLATHEELGLMVGVSRDRVTKHLRALRERGLVAFEPHRRGILVPDPGRLEIDDLD